MRDLLRDQVYADLKERILTDTFRGGDRLIIGELEREYGVSATPVREALEALECEDLVDIIPGVGCYVSQITLQDIRDIFELRLILEGATAQLAASRITDSQLTELERSQGEYEPGEVQSYLEFVAANRRFHCLVAEATGNKWLVDAVRRLLDQIQRVSMIRLCRTGPNHRMVDEHLELVAALRDRDEQRARAMMTEAITNANRGVMEALAANGVFPI